jgi:hypothetical protein
MRNPEAGAVVRASGGVRKLRWRRKGAGKRGGLRVIYLRPLPAERVLDAGAVCQGRGGDRAGPRAETAQGGLRE